MTRDSPPRPASRAGDSPDTGLREAVPSNLAELIALAFETASGTIPSETLLAAAAARFNAQQALFALWAVGDHPGVAMATHELDQADVGRWFEQHEDPESLFGVLARQPCAAVFCRDPSKAEMRGWPMAQVLAGVMTPVTRAKGTLVLLRSAGEPPFTEQDQADLRALLPFLERSARVNQHFLRYQQASLAAETMIDKALRAVLVLDEHGQVVYRNVEAQRILTTGDGLTLDGDKLVIADEDAQKRYRDYLSLVREQKRSGLDPGANPGCGIRVRRRGDRTAYQLVLYPLPNAHQQSVLDGYLGVIAAVVHDPDQIVGLSQEVLQRFFRLTPAESSLAGTLLRVHRLPDAARALGISVNTARTHLKSVFQKMGVNSQAALVQRLSQTLEIEPRRAPRRRASGGS